MPKIVCFFFLFVVTTQVFSQKQKLQRFIEKGKTFQQIYNKAAKYLKEENEVERSNINSKPNKNTKYLPEEEFMHLERWAWYWRDRLNPDGSFGDPTDQWNLYKNEIQKNSYLRQAPNWKQEGPNRNTGGYWGVGRTTCIDFHPTDPKTFFVATANGGLWKSTNSGQSYTSIGENLPQQPVGIVIVDPRNPNNIYISLGERDGWWQYGLGIYKTTNGGQSWSPTGLSFKLTDNKVVYGLAMNPTNSDILIAATNSGIYKTINGGTSWTQVIANDFSDVKFNLANSNIVYAARNDYWGSCEVFKSVDGGDNWNQITNFNKQKSFFRLLTTPADPKYIGVNASEDGGRSFYLSKDEGNKFEFISSPPENSVLFISPTDVNAVYSGYTQIHKSYDGGFSWETVTNWYNDGRLPEVHADHHYIAFQNRNRNELYFCNDGGLNKYDENSESWTELNVGLPITQFYKMAISTTTPPVLSGGSQDNGGFIRRSNGSWGNTNGGDAMWQLIDPTNAKIMFTEYYGGKAVYRSTDGYNNAVDIHGNLPKDIQGQWVTPFNFNPRNPKTFLIGFSDVYLSPNRGDSFTAISTNLTGADDKDLRNVDMSPVDTNIIFASYTNQLFYTYNYGKNWSRITLPTNSEISSFEYHPIDTNRMWVTRSGLGVFKVQESKDKGKTWKNISNGFVNTSALIVRFDKSSNTLFVGTDIGLFYSDADNINWQYYGTGLPNTSVTDIEFHQATRRMYVSTFGRGFYSIELPVVSSGTTITCPVKLTQVACQTQASIDTLFDKWKSTASFTGGCNPVLSNNGINKIKACGDSSIVTFTLKSDCDSSISCTSTFIVTSAPSILLKCPVIQTEAPCQTQAAIDAKFISWKNTASFTGGCNSVFTNNGAVAPNACGGESLITFTVSSTCGSSNTCKSTFIVTNSPVALTCPANKTEPSCQTQASINASFAAWKNTAAFSGGCNAVLSNTGGQAPAACGGSTTIEYKVISSCDRDITCISSFIVITAPIVVFNCPVNQTEAACQTQDTINSKFKKWKSKAMFTGGCNGIITYNNNVAPSACGGTAFVTFTVSSDCELAKTCNSAFVVDYAPKISLTCPDSIIVANSDIIDEVKWKYEDWLRNVIIDGGCNPVLSTKGDTTLPLAEGTINVIFSVTSDCDSLHKCSSKFIVLKFNSVDEIVSRDFELFPNPAKDFIILKNKNKNASNFDIQIIDMKGSTVKSLKNIYLTEEYRLKTDQIPSGNYFLKIIKGKNFKEYKFEINR